MLFNTNPKDISIERMMTSVAGFHTKDTEHISLAGTNTQPKNVTVGSALIINASFPNVNALKNALKL